MEDRTDFGLFPKFPRLNQFSYIANWSWKISSKEHPTTAITSWSLSKQRYCRERSTRWRHTVNKDSVKIQENLSNFDAIFVSKYDVTECFLLPLCLRSSTTFPLDGLYSLNWTNFPPKSTHQHQLLRDCYQNNATAGKEVLNDVIP